MIDKGIPPSEAEVENFLKEINFNLPVGFIDFYKETNGADIISNESNIFLWPISDIVRLNKEYNVEEYAPEFMIFGSDGGGMVYAIEKDTGDIYEIPFIGMSKEEAIFKNKTFSEFIGKG